MVLQVDYLKLNRTESTKVPTPNIAQITDSFQLATLQRFAVLSLANRFLRCRFYNFLAARCPPLHRGTTHLNLAANSTPE